MQYFIGKNGQPLGPFGEEQIKARVASGEFSTTDLVWCEGMASWEPVSSVFHNPYMPSAVLGVSPMLAVPSLQRLAGRGARLGAVTLNQLIIAATFIPFAISMWLMGPDFSAADELSVMQMAGLGVSCLLAIGLLVYQLMLYLRTGQTLGKKFMGVRVVRFVDGGNPGFGGLVGMREILPAVIGVIPLLGTLFAITDVCFIFREDQRCLHDLLAATKVVQA